MGNLKEKVLVLLGILRRVRPSSIEFFVSMHVTTFQFLLLYNSISVREAKFFFFFFDTNEAKYFMLKL